jgi:hypothetical protein
MKSLLNQSEISVNDTYFGFSKVIINDIEIYSKDFNSTTKSNSYTIR